MNSIDKLIFEASSVAANYASAPHRITAAKEVAALDLHDMVTHDQARSHIVIAIQQSVIALAIVETDDARASVAIALRSLVSAARAKSKVVQRQPSRGDVRLYWVEH